MIDIKPTGNLTGITIKGEYNDFDGLVGSIYRMSTTDEEKTDLYIREDCVGSIVLEAAKGPGIVRQN